MDAALRVNVVFRGGATGRRNHLDKSRLHIKQVARHDAGNRLGDAIAESVIGVGVTAHRQHPIGAIPCVRVGVVVGQQIAVGVISEAGCAQLVEFVEGSRRPVIVDQIARDIVAVSPSA